MITIDPQVVFAGFVASMTALVTAAGFWIRERALTRSYVEKQRADADRTKEETAAKRDNALIDIARQGAVVQQNLLEVVNQNTQAFTELTRSNNQSAAETRGMITMLNDNTRAVRSNTLAMDEMTEKVTTDLQDIKGVASTLTTDIRTTINEQLAPAVLAITGIGDAITTLVEAATAKDISLDRHLTELIGEFRRMHKELATHLEPLIRNQLGDPIHEPDPNHKIA